MQDPDESKTLVKQFSDRSRRVTRQGSQFVLPHKFSPEGEILDESNFNARRDISRLSLDDFRLLSALQEKKWDLKAACDALQIDPEKAARRYKKLSYFEFEEKKSQALAAVATPEFVTAKNIEGFYSDNLSDGQRDHLKELGKITGAYKSTAQFNIQTTIFNLPKMTPEAEAELRKIAEREADVVEATVVTG